MVNRRLLAPLFVLLLCGCDLQRNMLYYPDNSVPSQNELTSLRLQFWPSGPDGYRGFLSTIPAGPARGTVVVFHGNAGTAAHRDFYLHELAPLGLRVILAEYPGYGARKGKPSEAVFTNDANETLRLAREQYPGPLYVLGESLGCGVAAAAVQTATVRIDGLILITPWDTLHAVAKTHFPWLPVGLFLRDTYDSVNNLKAFPGRIAVIGAERDEVVPLRHAEALYESLPGTKRMWTVPGAHHNTWPDMVGPSWWRDVMSYVSGEDRAAPVGK